MSADLTPDFFPQSGEGLPDKAELAEVNLVKLLHLQGAEIYWRRKEQLLNPASAAGVLSTGQPQAALLLSSKALQPAPYRHADVCSTVAVDITCPCLLHGPHRPVNDGASGIIDLKRDAKSWQGCQDVTAADIDLSQLTLCTVRRAAAEALVAAGKH